MKPFATVSDIEQRWRTLTVDEKARAAALIEDSQVMIVSTFKQYNKDIEKADPQALRMVVCNMCQRVLSANLNAGDITQMTESAGPYSQTYTYSQPGTSLYIAKKERKLLGIYGARIGSVSIC